MRVFKTILFSSLIVISANASEDVWAEREALSNIQIELAALEALVLNARARSNTHFDYEILLSDLRKIQHGFSHHLTVPMEPVVPSTTPSTSNESRSAQRFLSRPSLDAGVFDICWKASQSFSPVFFVGGI